MKADINRLEKMLSDYIVIRERNKRILKAYTQSYSRHKIAKVMAYRNLRWVGRAKEIASELPLSPNPSYLDIQRSVIAQWGMKPIVIVGCDKIFDSDYTAPSSSNYAILKIDFKAEQEEWEAL